jgi:hypothetical protein
VTGQGKSLAQFCDGSNPACLLAISMLVTSVTSDIQQSVGIFPIVTDVTLPGMCGRTGPDCFREVFQRKFDLPEPLRVLRFPQWMQSVRWNFAAVGWLPRWKPLTKIPEGQKSLQTSESKALDGLDRGRAGNICLRQSKQNQRLGVPTRRKNDGSGCLEGLILPVRLDDLLGRSHQVWQL